MAFWLSLLTRMRPSENGALIYLIRVHSRRQWSFLRRFFVKCCFAALEFRGPAAQPRRANALRPHTRPDRLRPLRAERPAMPAASSDDARGASPAASVLAPSEGETEDPRISAYVAHLAHVGDEMAPGLGALFADAFPEVPTLADIHEGFTFSKNDSLLLFAGLDGNALTLALL